MATTTQRATMRSFWSLVSKLRREEKATGSLQISKLVSATIKSKSRLQKTIVLKLQPEAGPTKKRTILFLCDNVT